MPSDLLLGGLLPGSACGVGPAGGFGLLDAFGGAAFLDGGAAFLDGGVVVAPGVASAGLGAVGSG